MEIFHHVCSIMYFREAVRGVQVRAAFQHLIKSQTELSVSKCSTRKCKKYIGLFYPAGGTKVGCRKSKNRLSSHKFKPVPPFLHLPESLAKSKVNLKAVTPIQNNYHQVVGVATSCFPSVGSIPAGGWALKNTLRLGTKSLLTFS